jgi:hypothetical protein
MIQKNEKQKKSLDITQTFKQQRAVVFADLQKASREESILFSRGRKTTSFFTEDSKLYITPREQKLLRSGKTLDRGVMKWDALSSRIVNNFVRYEPSQSSILLKVLEERYAKFDEATCEVAKSFLGQFSTVRLWNASIVGSILFGMMMMTFVYRYLGQGAAANEIAPAVAVQEQLVPSTASVLGMSDTKNDEESFAQQVAEIEKIRSAQTLESDIAEMVKGYPIEGMVPYIAEQDRTVAAFIVAIARKESGWGVHVPVLNGQDCYNYWGYRGVRELMGTGGHTCFNSPEDAVDTVAKRIATLVDEYDRNTPEEMVVWKCGSNCDVTGGQAAANKWISDVAMYFDELEG